MFGFSLVDDDEKKYLNRFIDVFSNEVGTPESRREPRIDINEDDPRSEGGFELDYGIDWVGLLRGRDPAVIIPDQLFGKVVQVLLKHGSDPQIESSDGETPLEFALAQTSDPTWVLAARAETAGILVEKTPEIPKTCENAGTPLHLAAQGGIMPLIQALLNRGCDVRARNQKGETPLHQVVLGSGNPKAVQLLVTAGAEIDAADNEGDAALHLCAERDLPELADAPIGGGASLKKKNAEGRTPREIARAKGSNRFLRFLIDHRIESR